MLKSFAVGRRPIRRMRSLRVIGPSGGGTAGAGAYSRLVKEGDIIIIPDKVAHGWSQITDHVTYLSVRPDPERALPAGYVYPLLLKNLPTPAPPGPKK